MQNKQTIHDKIYKLIDLCKYKIFHKYVAFYKTNCFA